MCEWSWWEGSQSETDQAGRPVPFEARVGAEAAFQSDRAAYARMAERAKKERERRKRNEQAFGLFLDRLMEVTVKERFAHQRNDWKPRAEDRWEIVDWPTGRLMPHQIGRAVARTVDDRLVFVYQEPARKTVRWIACDPRGWLPDKADYCRPTPGEWNYSDLYECVRMRRAQVAANPYGEMRAYYLNQLHILNVDLLGSGKPPIPNEKANKAWGGCYVASFSVCGLRTDNLAPCKGSL